MAKNQDNPFHTGHGVLPVNFVEPPEGFVPAYDRKNGQGHSSSTVEPSFF